MAGPAALAEQPLFEPYADLLRTAGERLPSRELLDRSFDHPGPRPCLADGTPIRLIAEAHVEGYEAGIAANGGVPTRAEDWHDYFNALVWCRFPQAKATINSGHLAELEKRGASVARGPRRDALTQFDECGVVVSSSDPALLECLRQHAWRELFWEAREAWHGVIDVTVFGHATLDQLRAPFVGLCGKALLREVPADWFGMSLEQRCTELDGWIAAQISEPESLAGEKRLRPLPLLGIPGLVPDNAVADYYEDTRQFRPLRSVAVR